MKNLITFLLCFLIGFYGMSLAVDTTEVALMKSKIFFIGVLIATILIIVDHIKNK